MKRKDNAQDSEPVFRLFLAVGLADHKLQPAADAVLHDGEAGLSVEAGESGVRYAITGPDGEEIDSAEDWQPLIARLESDFSSAGESLQIIWQ